MVVVAVVVGSHQFVARDAVAQIKSFDHAEAFEQVERTIDRCQVAIAAAQTGLDLFAAHRVRMDAQGMQYCLALAGDSARLAPERIGQLRQFRTRGM